MGTVTTMARQDARLTIAAHAVRVSLVGMVEAIDGAHAGGLAIPPKVGEALAVLGALAQAWEANSRGVPAPEHVKAVLGLLSPEEVT